MQTSEPAATAAPDSSAPHKRVDLSEPWPHRGQGTEVTGYLPERRTGLQASDPLANRAVLGFATGAFALSLDPTAPELRALAHLCTTLADELDMAAQRDRAARQLAGDFALTERAA